MATIATIFSRIPRISAEYLAYAVILWALYLLLVRLLADPYFRARLMTLCALLFIAIAAVYVAVTVVRWIEVDAIGHELRGGRRIVGVGVDAPDHLHRLRVEHREVRTAAREAVPRLRVHDGSVTAAVGDFAERLECFPNPLAFISLS